MKLMIIPIFLFCPILFLGAKTKIPFPDAVILSDKNLSQTGSGYRKAGFFGTKVYFAALYGQPKTDEELVILLEYTYKKIKEKDMKRGWDKAIKKNCLKNCEQIKKEVRQFNETITTVKKGDFFQYIFRKDQIEIFQNQKLVGKISGRAFRETLLNTFIGPFPPTKHLKKKLLGIKK